MQRCSVEQDQIEGRYSFAHGRRAASLSYHKYAHANVSAASPLLNCHIDAHPHHPQQWVMLKARTHRPIVSKDCRTKLPPSSPQDVQRTPGIGLALPAHQERPRKGPGRTTKRMQLLSAPAATRGVNHGPRLRRPLRKDIATPRRRSPKLHPSPLSPV